VVLFTLVALEIGPRGVTDDGAHCIGSSILWGQKLQIRGCLPMMAAALAFAILPPERIRHGLQFVLAIDQVPFV